MAIVVDTIVTVVYKCNAHGCRSGHDNSPTASNVSFHKYPPENHKLCRAWVMANPRENFLSAINSKLCSLHIVRSDFVIEKKIQTVIVIKID